jgi:prophage antirepressor-like protein
MTTDITPFNFNNQQVRVVTDEQGEPWFVAVDVCSILGLDNVTRAIASLDDDEKNTIILNNGTPGNPYRAIISESGLYSLMMRSRKPGAKPFQRWVTHEVLPAIRKHGAYVTPTTTEDWLTHPDRMIEALTALKSEREARQVAEHRVSELEAPAAAWTALADADGDYSVGDAAKVVSRDPGVSIGRNGLFTWMGDHGWIYRWNHAWHAYQNKVNAGWLVQKVGPQYWNDARGEWAVPNPTIRVTPKGVERLRHALAFEAPLERAA